MLFAALTGGIAVVGSLLSGHRASRAREPCRSFQPVQLTGTLIEVRKGELVVPIEPAILDGVPRFICVSPTNLNQQTPWVSAANCDFPELSVNAMLTP